MSVIGGQYALWGLLLYYFLADGYSSPPIFSGQIGTQITQLYNASGNVNYYTGGLINLPIDRSVSGAHKSNSNNTIAVRRGVGGSIV